MLNPTEKLIRSAFECVVGYGACRRTAWQNTNSLSYAFDNKNARHSWTTGGRPYSEIDLLRII